MERPTSIRKKQFTKKNNGDGSFSEIASWPAYQILIELEPVVLHPGQTTKTCLITNGYKRDNTDIELG